MISGKAEISMLKLDFSKLETELLEAGMARVRVREMQKQIKQDLIDWPELYEENGKWSYYVKLGFIPGHAEIFGSDFNEETIPYFYSDFDYFMAHPLNNHFVIWINDKLTLKYMLNSEEMKQYVPKYYLYVENDGAYTYLMDSPLDLPQDQNYIFELLKREKKLALKPNHGAGGVGFICLEYRDGTVIQNGVAISKEELSQLIQRLNGYVITEYVQQSSELDKVFNGSASAFRIILYKKVKFQKEDKPEYDCLLAYARFGSRKSGSTCNVSHGGLSVRINWNTGKYEGKFRGRKQYWGDALGQCEYDCHPDTGAILDGRKIPHWEVIKDGLLKICDYLSSLDYFGMDVIVTEEGFKLCEINSAPSVGMGQFDSGKCCLDNDDAKIFAESKKRPCAKSFYECFCAAIVND